MSLLHDLVNLVHKSTVAAPYHQPAVTAPQVTRAAVPAPHPALNLVAPNSLQNPGFKLFSTGVETPGNSNWAFIGKPPVAMPHVNTYADIPDYTAVTPPKGWTYHKNPQSGLNGWYNAQGQPDRIKSPGAFPIVAQPQLINQQTKNALAARMRNI